MKHGVIIVMKQQSNTTHKNTYKIQKTMKGGQTLRSLE